MSDKYLKVRIEDEYGDKSISGFLSNGQKVYATKEMLTEIPEYSAEDLSEAFKYIKFDMTSSQRKNVFGLSDITELICANPNDIINTVKLYKDSIPEQGQVWERNYDRKLYFILSVDFSYVRYINESGFESLSLDDFVKEFSKTDKEYSLKPLFNMLKGDKNG